MQLRNTLVLPLVFAVAAQSAGKRPLVHSDYDSWRNIQNQQLSRDGKYLVYASFPQEGDGDVIVRNLVTGQERRENAGVRPPLPPPDPNNPESRPEPPRVNISFTADSRTVVFSTFPQKATPEKDKANGMVIMDLASGSVTRIPQVRSFQVPESGNGFIAWQREPKPTNTPAAPASNSQDADQGRRGSGGGSRVSTAPRRPADLVLRALAGEKERVFPNVLEYSLSKDAATLIYATGEGVYAADTASAAEPRALAAAKAHYRQLTWDEAQKNLAFLSDRDGGKFGVYLWDRNTPEAKELVSASAAGFRSEFVISDRGALNFSKDGQHLYFGCAPPAAQAAAAKPAAEQPSVDLWHWKDDFIQPMQKVRAALDRNRTFRAVYHLATGKFVQLGDATLPDITLSEDGRWGIGLDDREYRRVVEYDMRYADAYLVDAVTGARKPLDRKHRGLWSWSPDSRYLLTFDGKDWTTLNVASGATANLTATLGVKFADETDDHPAEPAPYGSAGWSKDGRSVLLYDRYDIWQIAPDGGSPRNLTAGIGRRQHLQMRDVKLDSDPRARDIDLSKPLLIRAENEDTRESGFYRQQAGATAAPQKLVMAAKYFTPPVKAKNADVLVLTASTFREFPDLLATDSSFRETRKVSDANPQQKDLLWGSAELIHYKNLDGVNLSGMLIKPENFDRHKKYPMIVYIYERLSQNLHHFTDPRPGHSINPSYYASNGYLVLQPDIVYTVGYPGQSALKCVLPAVQAVVDQGFVDENAIGIQGHSWGGYQIAYMVTQTNRFRAVAAGAPVANMISAYDGIRWGPGLPRQFQYEKTQSRIGGTLWQYPQRFIENSPIFMADRVRTPIMMIHNDADDAVPWYQGIEYYLALRRLGKEAYLFVYNGEPHGLRRRPNQKDYTVRLQQYFDHFLKGAPKPDWMEHGIPYIEGHPAAAEE
jgi:dienelactone hydrolase